MGLARFSKVSQVSERCLGDLCSRSHSTSSAFISRCKDVAGLSRSLN